MKKSGFVSICALALLSAVAVSLAESGSDAKTSDFSIVGAWQGTLDAMGSKLRIVFKVSQNPDGTWKTLMDSPDQGAKDIPVAETVLRGDSLIFRLPAIQGVYEGCIQPDRKSATGQWKQGGMTFPLALSKTDQSFGSNRPQEPKPPFPYNQEEIAFANPKAGIELSGTLTMPEQGGPFPAVILISGSGPQDRDESVFGHKPFAVLSDYLTRKGVAVLRYDDRGIGKSKGNFGTATTEDFASDALAAVGALKIRKDIRPAGIGLIGHSEGAIVAPMAANQSRDVAFVVLLACPGVKGEDLLYLQGALILKAQGADEKAISENEALQKRMFAMTTREKDPAEAAKKLRDILKQAFLKMTEEEKKASGFSEAAIEPQVQLVVSPWFRYLLTFDPRTNLSKLKCPVLALWGEKDLQVPPEQNRPQVEEALNKAGNRNVTAKVLPNLNHLFQGCTTGSPAEYSQIDETFSPEALAVIGGWIEGLERK